MLLEEVSEKCFSDTASWFLVPLGYIKILLFLKAQNRRIADMTNSKNLNNRRRQRNIISILFNLFSWFLDLIGDVLGQIVLKQNYVLFMALGLGFAAGLSPLVYMIGSGDFFAESKQSQEKRKNEVRKKKIDENVIEMKEIKKGSEPIQKEKLFVKRK